MLNEHIGEAPRRFADILSLGIVAGTIVDYLPAAAAVLSIIWTAMQIIDSRLFRQLVAKIRGRLS